MIGFTFKNIHSSNYNLGAKSLDRSLIPALLRNEFMIPGRHGTIDYGLNTYDKRMIQVELGIISNNFVELRKDAREIAKWLSGKGLLVFDDESDKAYNASLYSPVGINQIQSLAAGRATVIFECQPFAESLQYNQVNQNITQNAVSIPINIDGTAEAPCIITIKNNGLNTINSITITRKAAI